MGSTDAKRMAFHSLIVVGVMCSLPGNASAGPARKVVGLFAARAATPAPRRPPRGRGVARDPGNVLVILAPPSIRWDYLSRLEGQLRQAVFTARQRPMRGRAATWVYAASRGGVTHAVGSDSEAIDTAMGAARGAGHRHDRGRSASSMSQPRPVTRRTRRSVPILSAASVAISRRECRRDRHLHEYRATCAARRLEGEARRLRWLCTDIRLDAGRRGDLQANDGGLPGPILGATIIKLK